MSLDRQKDLYGTFILPVYNAESFLAKSLLQVHEWLATHPKTWELIIVDDASQDSTPEIINDFLSEYVGENIRKVRLLENRGKGFAIRVGFTLARGEYTVFTDCDLAYPLKNIERILTGLETGADAAIACRVLPESTYLISPSFFSYLFTRHISGRGFNLLCRIMTVPRILDTQAGLKGFRTPVVRQMLDRFVIDGFSFDIELLRCLVDRGARIVEVPVFFRYDSEPTTVRFIIDSLAVLRDMAHIRFRSILGRYRKNTWLKFSASLIIHADDYGLAPGVNRSIEESFESGAITSAAIMMGSPHSSEALEWAASHPQYDFGVHLNVTRGRPILPPEEVPSLVTNSGQFFSLSQFLWRFFRGRIRFEEVRAEWKAQIEKIRSFGVSISHLNSHEHVHLLPFLFSRVTVPIARERKLPIRSMNGPLFWLKRFPGVKGMLLSLVTWINFSRNAQLQTYVRGFGTKLDRYPTPKRLRKGFSYMKDGKAYELIVHPGLVDHELIASCDGYLRGRQLERAMIASPEFQILLASACLVLTDFSQLIDLL